MKNTNGMKDIDDHIVVTKNLCGFRGPDLNPKYKTKILFIGGSTTECICVSDGKDWPMLIGKNINKFDSTIWINNGGMGGNSTFGHLILLDYVLKKIKLDYVCFMVGINDAQIQKIRNEDKGMFEYFESGWRGKIMHHSRLAQTIKFIIGVKEAYQLGMPDEKVDFNAIQYVSEDEDTATQQQLRTFRKFLIEKKDTGYEHRIQRLIDLCKQYGVKPVFISQTTAYGFADPSSGKDLSRMMKVKLNTGIKYMDGKYAKEGCDVYNDFTRKMCRTNKVDFIELDSLIPKDSKNFIDFVHFNNTGCKQVSDIITPELIKILKREGALK